MALRVRQAAREQRHFHIVEHGEPGEQSETLKYDGYVRIGLGQRPAVPKDFAARGRGESGEDSEQRGLAGSGGSQQRRDQAGLHAEIGGRDNLHLAAAGPLETFFNLAGFNDRRLGRDGGRDGFGQLNG